jgi:trk system potassium uptake protein TrkH
MSGFTTTGATVIDASTSPNCIAGETPDCIQAQKRSLLLWRSITQWLGGMGVIMLGMLLLARYLGGGMSIARAELTGPSLSRLRPRLQQTAKVLWSIYTFFTFIEALLLKYVGKMSWFDAVNHALTTMPSGGFSTYSAGIMHFDSATIEWILITFMFISGVNFSIYHFILAKEWMRAFTDRETWVYILVLVSAWVAMALNLLWIAGEGGTTSFRQAAFQATAIGTSTGYASADFASWPTLSLMVLLFLMIVGASAGSTSGGLKILRLRVAYQLAKREISRISSPRKVHVVRLDGEVVPDDKLWVIVGMLSWWAVLAMGSIVLLAILEPRLDLDSVLSAVVASLGNTGPALGTFGPTQTWSSLSAPSMFWVTLLMWAGRLELLTVLVLFHRGTWSRERKD